MRWRSHEKMVWEERGMLEVLFGVHIEMLNSSGNFLDNEEYQYQLCLIIACFLFLSAVSNLRLNTNGRLSSMFIL